MWFDAVAMPVDAANKIIKMRPINESRTPDISRGTGAVKGRPNVIIARYLHSPAIARKPCDHPVNDPARKLKDDI